MKLPILIALLTLVPVLSGCYYVEPYPGPGGPIGGPAPYPGPPIDLPNRPGWTAAQISAFEQGQRWGRQDARRGYDPDFQPYLGEFGPALRPYAREGYRVGYQEYAQPDPGPGYDSPRERYYELGYDYGRRDYRDGYGPNHRRYRDEYPGRWETYFRAGYDDGYDGIPPRRVDRLR
jgi:hypothetical protein